MKPRHLLALVILVTLPLGAAIILGLGTLAQSESERGLVQSSRLLGRLSQVRDQYHQLERSWFDRLVRIAGSSDNGTDRLRELSLTEPLIRQAFRIDSSGRLVYPVAAGSPPGPNGVNGPHPAAGTAGSGRMACNCSIGFPARTVFSASTSIAAPCWVSYPEPWTCLTLPPASCPTIWSA